MPNVSRVNFLRLLISTVIVLRSYLNISFSLSNSLWTTKRLLRLFALLKTYSKSILPAQSYLFYALYTDRTSSFYRFDKSSSLNLISVSISPNPVFKSFLSRLSFRSLTLSRCFRCFEMSLCWISILSVSIFFRCAK